ncbi:Serine/threonine-protein kinase HSL1 [Elsinoe australis]|uniref:Serine/threonine-protein kinase HSL1 n=1 Tax=Elsinoe australis TaxID=40998 RepID=A0A2P8AFS0_9PEZI|nr:Serine/threonine-protein kinase HSL1 [Elsinoe australis]
MLPIQVGPCTGCLLHGAGWMDIKNSQCPYQLRTFGHAAVRQTASSRTRVPAPSKTIPTPSQESADSSQDVSDLSAQSLAPSAPREIPQISDQDKPTTLSQPNEPLAPSPCRTSSRSGAAPWITVTGTAKRPAPPPPRPAPIPDCIATSPTPAVS